MRTLSIVHFLVALTTAPLLLGVINRTKAWFGGRVGPPLLQCYYDVWKLLQKGAVYSRSTTWIFGAGPIVGLAAVLTALTLVPFGGAPSLLPFSGDFLLLVYLLGLARFFTIIAALDTGSSLEGMGASREAFFSALVEPALLLALAAMARETHQDSLSTIHAAVSSAVWGRAALTLVLVMVALGMVLLTENCRIPVDDPNTHLELTMIHEVMVLDHGGPDLAFILYAAALKLWLIGAVLINLVLPARSGVLLLDSVIALGAMFGLAVVIGIIESSMARLRLIRIPHLLVGASALAALAFVLERQDVLP